MTPMWVRLVLRNTRKVPLSPQTPQLIVILCELWLYKFGIRLENQTLESAWLVGA